MAFSVTPLAFYAITPNSGSPIFMTVQNRFMTVAELFSERSIIKTQGPWTA